MPRDQSPPTLAHLTPAGFLGAGDRRPPAHVKTPQRTFLRVRMYETLNPGSIAEATILDWTGLTYGPNNNVERLTIYDPLYRVFALKDEDIDVVWMTAEERWETTGLHGLYRKGKLTGSLSPHGLQTVALWTLSAAVDPAVNVDVNDFLLRTTDSDLVSGTRVEIYFDQTDRKWVLAPAACGAE